MTAEIRNKAVYVALGILPDGTKEILGIADVLIAVVDGLKGFPEAINAVFPQTVVQTCIVHLIRHSLEFVSWKDRKPVVPAVRRHVDAVELLQMPADLAHRHAARIHEDDLVVEIGKAALVFGDQLRIEGSGTVARDRQRHLRCARQH